MSLGVIALHVVTRTSVNITSKILALKVYTRHYLTPLRLPVGEGGGEVGRVYLRLNLKGPWTPKLTYIFYPFS